MAQTSSGFTLQVIKPTPLVTRLYRVPTDDKLRAVGILLVLVLVRRGGAGHWLQAASSHGWLHVSIDALRNQRFVLLEWFANFQNPLHVAPDKTRQDKPVPEVTPPPAGRVPGGCSTPSTPVTGLSW